LNTFAHNNDHTPHIFLPGMALRTENHLHLCTIEEWVHITRATDSLNDVQLHKVRHFILHTGFSKSFTVSFFKFFYMQNIYELYKELSERFTDCRPIHVNEYLESERTEEYFKTPFRD